MDQFNEDVRHQDALMWSRVQTLIAVQGAALGGGQAFRQDWRVSGGAIVLGMVLTLMILVLAELDRRLRDNAAADLRRRHAADPAVEVSAVVEHTRFGWGRWITYAAYAVLLVADVALLVDVVR